MNRLQASFLALLTAVGFFAFVSQTQAEVRSERAHLGGSDSISELSRRGKHFEAVAKLYEHDSEPSLGDQLAAARSAWALGLVSKARELWDEALANRELDQDERSRAILARSIVELQESNFEEARSIAERSVNGLTSSDLRSQFWLVIAEALKEQNAYSLAEGYYKKAIKDGSGELQTEARFLLGECQLKLGMMNESRYSFASVDSGSQYTLQALRRLMEIDINQRNYEGVLTWVQEGRDNYPGEFKDGWVSYTMISSLTELGRNEDAKQELREFSSRRSENDPWFILASAALEATLVRSLVLNEVADGSQTVAP